MCDPFFMGILLHHLGKDFVIWDKEATIKFKRPGKGQVRATFEISPQEIEHIRQSTINHGKMEPVFKTTIRDLDDNVIAEVEKTVYVKSKAKS